MKPTPEHSASIRQLYLEGSGLVGPLETDALQRSRVFIKTMEQFIYSSETSDVTALTAKAQTLSDEARDEFWQWHYPVHWQDIFGVRIRSAFCAQLCSLIEAVLGDIARRIEVIDQCVIALKQLNAPTTLGKYKLYLEAFGKFTGPSPEAWKNMGFLFRIRNAHIHEQGYAGDLSSSKGEAFRVFLAGLPGVNTHSDFIELRADSCLALLDITERFHHDLLREFEAYRQRALIMERLSTAPTTRPA